MPFLLSENKEQVFSFLLYSLHSEAQNSSWKRQDSVTARQLSEYFQKEKRTFYC